MIRHERPLPARLHLVLTGRWQANHFLGFKKMVTRLVGRPETGRLALPAMVKVVGCRGNKCEPGGPCRRPKRSLAASRCRDLLILPSRRTSALIVCRI